MAEFEMEEVGKGIKKVGQIIAKNPLLLAGVVAGGGVLIWSLFLRNGRGQADPLRPQPLHAGLPRQTGELPVRGAPPRVIPREGREPLPAAGGLPVTTPPPPVTPILPVGPFLPADALPAYVRHPQPSAAVPAGRQEGGPPPRLQPIPPEMIMPYMDPGEVTTSAYGGSTPMNGKRRIEIPSAYGGPSAAGSPYTPTPRTQPTPWETIMPYLDPGEVRPRAVRQPYIPTPQQPSTEGGPYAPAPQLYAPIPYIPTPPPRTQPVPFETIMPYMDPW